MGLLLIVFYPIWGTVALGLLAFWIANHPMIAKNRLISSSVSVILCTSLFSPCVLSDDGAALLVPWYLGNVFSPDHWHMSWPLVALVLSFAFLCSLVNKKINRFKW